MDNVAYDEHSIIRKNFAGLHIIVDMKQAVVMKSSNVVGNVVADKFVDGHLHNFTRCSNENVMADNMFVDDHFQKLSKISHETGNLFFSLKNCLEDFLTWLCLQSNLQRTKIKALTWSLVRWLVVLTNL